MNVLKIHSLIEIIFNIQPNLHQRSPAVNDYLKTFRITKQSLFLPLNCVSLFSNTRIIMDKN